MIKADFKLSEQGADSAWKGFTSQSLYILFRIIKAEDDFDYCPEKLEDLMIMQNKKVIEVVQVKDYVTELTTSDLDASTKTEGLFRRAITLKKEHANLIIKVVYFGELGPELSELAKGKSKTIETVTKKLCDKYGFSKEDATWLLSRLKMEKVTHEELEKAISEKVEGYVPTMAAPDLAKDLLAYYIFKLSKSKGKTSKKDWQEKVIQIGNDLAAFDGYSREYGGSLIRLADIPCESNKDGLEEEFRQGVSTRPEHIFNGLDLVRASWLEKITKHFVRNNAVVVKGASGQGKTALCYRYLYNEYAPENVFCIRAIRDQTQAENLVKAMVGLSRHYSKKLIVYIDVNPGETYWTWVLREAKVRSYKVKILVSIREEDFKLSNVDTSLISPEIINLYMGKDEALGLYNTMTSTEAHPIFRTFEDAWSIFGEYGPLLEFIFLLKNNQTLKQRLEAQVEKLRREAGIESDQWLAILRLVSYASKNGCPSLVAEIKKSKICDNLYNALNRMAEEYLIRNTVDGRYLEALHPIRAKILYDILKDKVLYPEQELLLKCLSFSEKHFVKILLLNYFIEHDPNDDIITQIARIAYKDWEAYAGAMDAMIWLDVRGFISNNVMVFDLLIKERGQGWICFSPLDISGFIRPNETMAEKMRDMIPKMAEEALKVKAMFGSLIIDYHYYDLWLSESYIPDNMPTYDVEWMYLGYSLFWMSKRGKIVEMFFDPDKLKIAFQTGTIEYRAAVLQGLYSQCYSEVYNDCTDILINRIIKEYKVIFLNQDDTCVTCQFVPPLLSDVEGKEEQKNINHYWTMKMVDILSRIYPEKPYIEVKLIGIDLFGELGIKSLDHIKKIPLENRPDKWITQINVWYKNLIDYRYRPNNWNEYVEKVMSIRREITGILSSLIKEIDNLYQKGYVKNTKVINDTIDLGQKLSRTEILLPIICVDKFGAYGEGNNQDKLLRMSVNLSVYETLEFRNSIREIFSSLQNYTNQFGKILIARKDNQDISDHLSELNIYAATKALYFMQKEFKKLFAKYLPQDYDGFEIFEKNTYHTLLGVWNEVMHTPIRQMGSLSYNVNVVNKKIGTSLKKALQRLIDSGKIPVTLIEINNDTKNIQYFLYECNLVDGIPVEKIYAAFCLALRKAFKEAVQHNCFRCLLETEWSKMIFVPLYGKSPSCAFSIPIYILLDTPETELSNTLFPETISDEIYKTILNETEKSAIIRKCILEIGKLRLLLMHYNQVLDTINEDPENVQSAGLEVWFAEFVKKLTIDEGLLSAFISSYELPKKVENEYTIYATEKLSEAFNKLSNLSERLSKLESVNDIVDSLQNTMGGMIALLENP